MAVSWGYVIAALPWYARTLFSRPSHVLLTNYLGTMRYWLMIRSTAIAAFALSISAYAQGPKVVFIGDNLTAQWQSSPQFTANTNWVGEGIAGQGYFNFNFQSVINQHPAFVHIMAGYAEGALINDAIPAGTALQGAEADTIQKVGLARRANIKVILGNLPQAIPALSPNVSDSYNAWLDQYGRANGIPVVNYNAAFGNTYPSDSAGYALLTQMAQIAIATYGLTIKGGYLSDIALWTPTVGEGCCVPRTPTPQVNTVLVDRALIFTPQATWSDGVTRPMLNPNFDGMQGIWMSSNPSVMYISQQGQAVALGAGTTSISFIAASGQHFSPWTMYVNLNTEP